MSNLSGEKISPEDIQTLDEDGTPRLLTSDEALVLLDEFRDSCWRLIATPWPPKGTKRTPRQEAEAAAERYIAAKELVHIALTGLPLPPDHHIRRRPQLNEEQPTRRRQL